MRPLTLAAGLALLLAIPAHAQSLDANGKCRGPGGKFAKPEACAKGHGAAMPTGFKMDAKGKCRDAKGKYVKSEMCRKAG